MRKLLTILLLISTVSVYAQYTVNVTVNTPNTPSISVIVTNLGNGTDSISAIPTLSAFLSANNAVSLASSNPKVAIPGNLRIAPSFRADGIRLVMTGLSKTNLDTLSKYQSSLFLSLKDSVQLTLQSGSKYTVTQSAFQTGTTGQIILNESLITEYLGAFGGEFAYASNHFHWGFTPATQSDNGKFELNAEFAFRKNYSKIKNLIFYTKGRVSTNAKDSLNYLYIYPINFSVTGKKKTTELFTQLGMESNQTFSTGRVAFALTYQTLIPNFVDLTMGNNRLRLKPVFNFGLKAYQEFDNMRMNSDNQFSVQANASLYYNIPLFDYYNIIVESTGFYDFSKTVNPKQDIQFNYSISLGAKLPGTPFQTLFRYKDGAVDVNNLADNNVTIGLLADFESLLSSKK